GHEQVDRVGGVDLGNTPLIAVDRHIGVQAIEGHLAGMVWQRAAHKGDGGDAAYHDDRHQERGDDDGDPADQGFGSHTLSLAIRGRIRRQEYQPVVMRTIDGWTCGWTGPVDSSGGFGAYLRVCVYTVLSPVRHLSVVLGRFVDLLPRMRQGSAPEGLFAGGRGVQGIGLLPYRFPVRAELPVLEWVAEEVE